MPSDDDNGLSNHPVVVTIMVVAALAAITAYVSGKPTLGDLLGPPISHEPTPSPHPTSTPTLDCSQTVNLGPWEPINGQGQDVFIDAKDGWVQADFWFPGYAIEGGYDEVSVIFEPGWQVTVTGVSGNGWKYDSTWSREDVDRCTAKHMQDTLDIRHKRQKLISVKELCEFTTCP